MQILKTCLKQEQHQKQKKENNYDVGNCKNYKTRWKPKGR